MPDLISNITQLNEGNDLMPSPLLPLFLRRRESIRARALDPGSRGDDNGSLRAGLRRISNHDVP